jgi:hypothetical protein
MRPTAPANLQRDITRSRRILRQAQCVQHFVNQQEGQASRIIAAFPLDGSTAREDNAGAGTSVEDPAPNAALVVAFSEHEPIQVLRDVDSKGGQALFE